MSTFQRFLRRAALSALPALFVALGAGAAQGATIEGRVTGPGAAPVPGAIVMAQTYEPNGLCFCGLPKTVGTATAGADGRYAVTELPEGRYFVLFDDPAQDLAYQYYPGVTFRYSLSLPGLDPGATVFDLGAAETETDVDARLKPGGTISGRITDGDGGPLADAPVSIDASGGVAREVRTDADGRYEARGLAANFHSVAVNPPWTAGTETYYEGGGPSPGGQVFVGQLRLDEAERRTGIDLQVHRGVTIKGRLTLPSGEPAVGFRILTTLAGYGSAEAPPSGYPSGTVELKSDAEGQYVLPGAPPGSYTVEFRERQRAGEYEQTEHAPGWWAYAKKQSAATPLVLGDGDVAPEIDHRFERASSIAGSVHYASDLGRRSGVVHLYDAEGEDIAITAYRADPQTPTIGTYRFPVVAPGTYRVGFGAPSRRSIEQAVPALFSGGATTLATAAPVVVPEGAAIEGVDATIQHLGTISGELELQRPPFAIFDDPVITRFLAPRPWAAVVATDTEGVQFRANVARPGDSDYTVAGLPSGTYRVCTEMPTDRSLDRCVGGRTYAEAAPIEVGVDEDVVGRDLLVPYPDVPTPQPAPTPETSPAPVAPVGATPTYAPAPTPAPAPSATSPLADRVGPTLNVALPVTRAARAALRRTGRLRLTVTVGEKATLTVSATTTRTPGSKPRTVLKKTARSGLSTGKHTLGFTLSGNARRSLRRGDKVTFTVVATDAAGNRTTRTRTVTVG